VCAVVGVPDGDSFAPVRIHVGVRELVEVRRSEARRRVRVDVVAEAELAPGILETLGEGGGYDGPLAYRQGKPMRPGVSCRTGRPWSTRSAERPTRGERP
jgi:hypothetical protein